MSLCALLRAQHALTTIRLHSVKPATLWGLQHYSLECLVSANPSHESTTSGPPIHISIYDRPLPAQVL